MTLQDADTILLEPFLNYFSSMFWIVVMLELPVVAKLEILCRFLQVFIKDLDEFIPSHDFLNPEGIPEIMRKESCALGREAST